MQVCTCFSPRFGFAIYGARQTQHLESIPRSDAGKIHNIPRPLTTSQDVIKSARCTTRFSWRLFAK
jgi:hypothetical protein